LLGPSVGVTGGLESNRIFSRESHNIQTLRASDAEDLSTVTDERNMTDGDADGSSLDADCVMIAPK